MAILAKIRQRTLVLILIIGLALFAFVISDVFNNSDNGAKQPSEIGMVNGESIPLRDFQYNVKNIMDQSRGSQSTIQVVNNVWDQQLRNQLIAQQLDELGITIEKDEIWNLIIANPNFTNNPQFQDEAGVFVEGKLREYVNTLEATKNDKNDPTKAAQYQSWLATEEFFINQAKQNLYYNLVKSGSIATVKEGEMAYRLENDKVTFKYVQIPYNTIKDEDVKIKKSDIKNYIDNHKSMFEEKASRDIQYVYFEEKASKADEDDAKAEITKLISGFEAAEDAQGYATERTDTNESVAFVYKNELPTDIAENLFATEVGKVFGPYKVGDLYKISKVLETKQMPDSVKNRHILIRFQGSAGANPDLTKTKEEAKKQADSILAVVKRNKSKFADIAEKMSDDGSKSKGGELGWYSNTTGLTPTYKEYIFGNKVGDMDVVESPFGYHIIEIQDQKNMQKTIKLATITKLVESSEKTLSDLFTTASKFESDASKSDDAFVDIATQNNYKVNPINKIGILDSRISGINTEQRQIVRWAFEDETNVGDIKRFPVSNGFVVAQLTKKHKEGLASVEDASARVIQYLRDDKKAEMIKANNTATTLADLAAANNVQVQTATSLSMSAPIIPGGGEEKKVVGAAFALEEGATSKLIAGTRGVYMIEVVTKTAAPEKDSYLAEMNSLRNQRASTATNSVFNALKSASEIEDNRSIFY
ncbi:peptidylprolyl isomerase [Kordia jejudonensis]|uniref:peptidylprolyl isomerase n=1 Tax=Kordia jejudonensis TaxID=1348245 RepID=UPI000629B6A2|nr:peptidylprolyl isomerase [Kordia jejudonensis]